MKNILTILLLTLTVSCFGQTYGWMITKDPAQNADTANVLVMFPTGHANLTGRGHFISYETFAGLIESYLSVSGSNMANANQTITGDRTHNLGGNDFMFKNLQNGRFSIRQFNTEDSSFYKFTKDSLYLYQFADNGSNKFAEISSFISATPEAEIHVDDGSGNASLVNVQPDAIRLDADSYILQTLPASGASTDSILTVNTSTGEIRAIDQSSLGGAELKLNISDTAAMLSHFIERSDTSSMLNHYIARSDTAAMLDPYVLDSEIERTRTIYIDNFEGDPGNTGLSEDQAVTSPTDVTLLDNDIILLRGGGIYYEEFDLSAYDNITLSRYGGGEDPIIDGSATIGAWTDTSTIHKVSISNDITTGRIRLYRNDKPFKRAASLADCIATLNTYYIKNDGAASASTTTIYLNVADETLDNWTYTKREYAVQLSTGIVRDIQTRKAISNNGSTVITGEGQIIRGRADYGSKHNAFIGNGTIDGLKTYQSDATTIADPTNTALVSYSNDADSMRINFDHVEIINDDNDFTQEVALISHGLVDGFDEVTISNSTIKNLNLVFAGDCDLGYLVNNQMQNVNRLFDVDASDSLLYVANNNVTFSRLIGTRSGVSKHTVLERNLFYYPQADNATGNAAFYHTGSDKILDMFNNIMIVEGRRVIDAASTGGTIIANENILVSTATNERLIYVPSGVTYIGDHNIFFAGGTNETYNIFGATTCETLAEWQSVSSQDANSVWLTDEQYKNLWVKSNDGYVVNPKLEVTTSSGAILEGYFPDSTRITFGHVFKSLLSPPTDADWYESAASNPTDNTATIYHDGNVIVGDSIFSSNGKLNVVGRIDQRFPNTSLSNVIIGNTAGNTSASGDFNVGVGYAALASILGGSNNLALGESSLNALTTGIQNVAIGGQSCLLGNPSASVAIGFQAMRSGSAQNTVAVGYGAAFAGGGNYAVHIGQEAGYKTTGGNNTFIGANAGHENVTGTSNVFIGQNAGYNETGSNFLYVDNSNTATPLIKGDFNSDTLRINGALSIGTVASGASTDSILVRTAATGKVKARNASLYATAAGLALKVNISDTASMLSHYIERQDTASMLSHYIERQDTASMLSRYIDRASAETIYGVKTFNADPIVPAEAYAVGWNGSNEPPTKNDVYDKIETLVTSASSTANQIAYITGANTISGRTTFTDDGTTLTHRSASNGTGGNFRLSRADGNPVVQMGTYSSAFPGYGGYWGGNITPSGTNYAFISDGTSETIFNGVTLKFRISHANAMVVNSSSDVGVGIDAASARLHLLKTTEQLRVGYDASNYFSTTVGSSGIATLNAVGSSSSFVFSDPFANTATSLTLGAAATTFALTSNVMTITGNGGGNTLATITAGFSGQILTLIFADANVTITDDATGNANTVNLSAAFTSTANDVVTLVSNGTSWREVSRSIN